MRALHIISGATIALLAAVPTLAWTTLEPRVEAGGAEYAIQAGRLTHNGVTTAIPALLVGICEDASVWVLARSVYGSRPFKWGRVERGGNWTDDPLTSDPLTVRWSQSPVPGC